jgi:PAS domain S-box-containing protein
LMLGYSREEFLRLKLHECLSAFERPRLARQLKVPVAAKQRIETWEHVRKDGSTFLGEVNAQPIDGGRTIAVIRDVTDRCAQDALVRQLSMAVQQSTESVVIIDALANIEYVNAAAISSSGYSEAELIGQNSRMLESGNTPAETINALWAAVKAAKPWKGLLFNRRKDGTKYVEFASLTPLRSPQGKVTQFVVVKDDVTEKRRMGEELDRHRNHLEEQVAARTAELALAKQAAEAANEAKSAFLATMSHEIRTPMNGVVGIVDVLRQSTLTPYQNELTATIRESGFALLRIIDEILDFSKIEAGALAIENEPMLLRHVIEGACDALQLTAKTRGAKLDAFIDPALPARIESDAMRVQQIVNNLLSNAIKFSSGPGRVGHIRLRVERADDAQFRISVSDNGIGIAEEVQQRIFQPFVQAEDSTTRRFGGTGLGLTICSRLTHLLGGTIAVVSAPGTGATFSVTLPLVKAADETATKLSCDLSGLYCHVILADEPRAQDWCTYLRSAGASAQAWRDLPAMQVSGALNLHQSSVIVADSSCDDQALARLESASTRSELNFVHVKGSQGNRVELIKPGHVSLSADLLRQAALMQAVALASGRSAREPDSLPASVALGNGAPPTIAAAAAAGRLVLVAEDNDINQKVIHRQLALLGLAAEVAGDGIEALARWRSGSYGLLLTDLHMPGMDGYELATTIRSEEAAGQRMPILALTANALRGEADRCRAVGMDDYLSKPVLLEHLAAKLAQWLPTAGSAAPSELAALTNDSAVEATLAIMDQQVLPRIVGNDMQMLIEFRQDFITSASATALELRAAFIRSDWSKVGALAHRLKSSSRAVGAMALGATCESLESAGKQGDESRLGGLVQQFDIDLAKAVAAIAPLCVHSDAVHDELRQAQAS